MQLLAIANAIPMRNRSAGSFRFFSILELLDTRHEVHLHARVLASQERQYGREAVDSHRKALQQCGVQVTDGSAPQLNALLRSRAIDVAFLEYYQSAKQRVVQHLRLQQPRVRIVVDTVEVAFNRPETKARLTWLDEDRRRTVKFLQPIVNRLSPDGRYWQSNVPPWVRS